MAIFFDEPKRRQRAGWLFSLLLIFLIVLVIGYPEWELKYRNAQVETVSNPPAFREEPRQVMPDPVGGFRPDVMEGRIFQHRFSQEGATSGRSPDELAITFPHPVALHGIHVSADCWKDTRLVEFVGGIDQRPAYQTNGNETILFHVTFATTDTAGVIEQTFLYPRPFFVGPGQAIRIGAWIQNNSPDERFVSPEFVLYFTGREPPFLQPSSARRSVTPPRSQPLPPLPDDDAKPRKPPKKTTGD